MKIHWTCESPSHYNAFFFRTLHDACLATLIVHFRRESASTHPWRSPLRAGFVSRIQYTLFSLDWMLLTLPFRDRRAFFMVAGWNSPTGIMLLLLCVALRRRYAIWTDTPNEDRIRAPMFALFRRRLLKMFLSRAFAVLGTGAPAVAALTRMGATPKQLIAFPFWIDLHSFRREAPPCSNAMRSLRFFSAGRVQNSAKGHDLAIRSLAAATKRVPSFNFTYEIAGIGPDLVALRTLAAELNIEDKIVFLGWIEATDVTAIMCRSDVLLHPSPDWDPFAVAVLEAMAAGMIVFASDRTGSALDRINHGVNGFIHQAGNVDDLSDQIIASLSSLEDLSLIGLAARTTAEEWPVSRGVDAIRALVNNIAHSHPTLST